MLFFSVADPSYGCFAKDPCVVSLNGTTYLYYSKPVIKNGKPAAYRIGIASSDNLDDWYECGELAPEQKAEGNGICAPGAIVIDGVLHLFYQSYGQFPKDHICHAVSTDGIRFYRDESNPVMIPEGSWNNHRAIDADVVQFHDELFLYWATRDPEGKTQMLGVSTASINSSFQREDWHQRCDGPILKPELEWEKNCIEAPASIVHNGKVYLFYAGAYNCSPQQIGCAVSDDGIRFSRLFNTPLLPNGKPGSWNASESGHPYVWRDPLGAYHLFYQGSPDNGHTWLISRARLAFSEEGMPIILANDRISAH